MSRCELCGAEEETRPYGPNGERVCFACGMKNEEAARAAFKRLMGGARSILLTEDGPVAFDPRAHGDES